MRKILHYRIFLCFSPTGKPLTFADLQESQEDLVTKKQDETKFVNIEDIINMPGRLKRPPKVNFD